MDKKYEQLIDLIINEDNDKARELFHEIVVDKSREIYESIMAEEMDMEESAHDDLEESMDDDMDEGMGGQVGDLLDEINAEESGVTEEEEEEVFDLDAEEEGDMGDDEGEASEEVEDAVVRIEDKLDQLMAEFEKIMGDDGLEDEEGEEEEVVGDEEEEEAMMEAVQLQKISVTHGDNGAQTKSPGLQNSGQAGMDSHPVKFSGHDESVPTSPKGPNNAYSKGETHVKGAGSFKNAPGHKGQDLSKTPAPVKKDGAAYTKSPIAK